MCSVSLVLYLEETLLLFVFASLSYSLEVLTRDKDWLFTLFLLLLLFLRANGGLIFHSSTGAHLSLISGNAKRRLDDCKCPVWSPSVSCFRAMVYAVCLVAQSCPALCDPMDFSPPDFVVHGILQARIWKWVAILFSRGSSQPRDQTWVSCMAGRFFTI